MNIVKWILVVAVVLFFAWQIYGLVKDILERNKNKKAKKQIKAEAVATEVVDKKEEM